MTSARYYDYDTGAEAEKPGHSAKTAQDNIYVRGGNIVPAEEPANNSNAKTNMLGLIVALDERSSAFGSLYYDDGDSIDPFEDGSYFYTIFSAANRTIRNSIVHDGCDDKSTEILNTIRLLGAGTVKAVYVNGIPHSNFTKLSSGEVVISNLDLPVNSAFLIHY